jgi:hypothetical protein
MATIFIHFEIPDLTLALAQACLTDIVNIFCVDAC